MHARQFILRQAVPPARCQVLATPTTPLLRIAGDQPILTHPLQLRRGVRKAQSHGQSNSADGLPTIREVIQHAPPIAAADPAWRPRRRPLSLFHHALRSASGTYRQVLSPFRQHT